jgi:hypothetical protein
MPAIATGSCRPLASSAALPANRRYRLEHIKGQVDRLGAGAHERVGIDDPPLGNRRGVACPVERVKRSAETSV